MTLRRGGDPYDGARRRLPVIEVIAKDWLRSQLLAEAEEDGELYFGSFRTSFTAPPAFDAYRYRVTQGQKLHLVCRGCGWQLGDVVPVTRIVYCYDGRSRRVRYASSSPSHRFLHCGSIECGAPLGKRSSELSAAVERAHSRLNDVVLRTIL